MDGKLCVSIIEARNVYADEFAEQSFYVRLRVGHSEAKTEVVRNSTAPKFLKDVRLEVANPEQDVMRIELLQCGPRGDLVVGSGELHVSSMYNKGTLVHWFELISMDDEVTAELCLVMRYLQAGGSRPMTPSYAIAARDAKQKALDGASTEAQVETMQPSKAIFADLPQQGTQPQEDPQAQDEAQPQQPMQAHAQATIAPITPAKQVSSPFGRAPGSPETDTQAADQATAQQPGAPGETSTGGASTATAASTSARLRERALSPLRKASSQKIPLPLALMGGAVAGALVYLLKRQPVLWEEGEMLCSIGTCVKRDFTESYSEEGGRKGKGRS